MSKKKNVKPYTLKANDKNLVSSCVGIIVKLLENKRSGFFDSFEETFEYFQEHVEIPSELRVRVDRGTPKWQQAIRNAAKVKRENKKPDALTQHELFALVHGGFALPDCVPNDREAVSFPDLGGFKVSKVKSKKEKPKLEDPTFWADRIENLMIDVDPELIRDVCMELCARYSLEVL